MTHPQTASHRLAEEAQTGVDGLYASAPQRLPFAPSLDVRAFLLERDSGNLLVYSVTELDDDTPWIASLGGISRRYLNHRHEAMFASHGFSAPLFVHEDERGAVSDRTRVRGTFSRRHLVDDDFEVIPTPGHTRGAAAYLWDSGQHRVLFTGDTVYLHEGEWIAAVLDSSDRQAYIETLELLRQLDFDVLVPWAATAGHEPYAITGKADSQRRIEAILDRVRKGEDH